MVYIVYFTYKYLNKEHFIDKKHKTITIKRLHFTEFSDRK
jgi:hypothetical protein